MQTITVKKTFILSMSQYHSIHPQNVLSTSNMILVSRHCFRMLANMSSYHIKLELKGAARIISERKQNRDHLLFPYKENQGQDNEHDYLMQAW